MKILKQLYVVHLRNRQESINLHVSAIITYIWEFSCSILLTEYDFLERSYQMYVWCGLVESHRRKEKLKREKHAKKNTCQEGKKEKDNCWILEINLISCVGDTEKAFCVFLEEVLTLVFYSSHFSASVGTISVSFKVTSMTSL